MKYLSHVCIILFSTLSIGCQDKTDEKPNTTEGVWESVGYGRIVNIEDGEFILADVTKFSCMELMSGEISDLGKALELKNDTLSLKDGINIYYFTRIDNAPTLCVTDSPERKLANSKANDPEHNFEALWDTFKTHYAYFDLRGVDPDKMYAEYRPRVTSNTTEAELFFIIYDMLESFDDGHISIEADDDIMDEAYKLYLTKYPNEEEIDLPKLRKHNVAKAVADKYIPDGQSVKNGNLRWGILKDNVGYLQLNQMMGLADYSISDTLSYANYWRAYFEKLETVENDTADELKGLNTTLDIIMKDFDNTNALIIDVRFNGGGKDEVGMDVLKRLNAKEQIVFTKKARLDDSYTPIIKVSQPAVENPYNKPVYLLISVESASATEIMALSSLSMPNVTRIGAATEGVFSDVLDKELPNGWEFGLSSEVYLDMNGINYESKGIPADIKVDYKRDTQKFLQKVMSDLTENDACIQSALDFIKD